MIDLGLSAAQHALFEATLTRSHRTAPLLYLYDGDEKLLGSLGSLGLFTGAVQFDRTADVTRSLSVTIAEPRHINAFEPDSPTDGALYPDQFLYAARGVFVPELAGYVFVPLFFGPITMVERGGAEIQIEAQGKERLMLAPHYAGRPYNVRKRTRVDDAIKQVAYWASGELRFALPDLPRRLPRSRGVGIDSEPWKVIAGGEENAKGRRLSGLVDRGGKSLTPFYDGYGRLAAAKLNRPPAWVFREGVELLDIPTITYDQESFRNTVIVRGGKRKKRPRAEGRAHLPAKHPLSPQKLGRNDRPRYLIEFVEKEGLRTDAQCDRHATEVLNRLSGEGVTASFNSLPIPHLTEVDNAVVETDGFRFSFPIEQMSIPLHAGESMAVGGTKPIRRGRKLRLPPAKNPHGHHGGGKGKGKGKGGKGKGKGGGKNR